MLALLTPSCVCAIPACVLQSFSPPAGSFTVNASAVSAEWIEHRRTPVLTTTFDPSSIDTIADIVLEAIRSGNDPKEAAREYAREDMEDFACEALTKALDYIIYSDKPRLAAIAIADVSGMFVATEKSGPERAKEHAISKQAYQQRLEEVRRQLNMRKTRNNRDQEAKTKFSNRNFRRSSPKQAETLQPV